MIYKYICSIGSLCHPASFLKQNKLKLQSFPFDWIFSDINIICACLEDNFKEYLNKDNYIKLDYNENKCGHKLFHRKMFNHHNPLLKQEDYEYFKRCIVRFRKLLSKKEPKIFLLFLSNRDEVELEVLGELIRLDSLLKQKTENYKILVIYHLINDNVQKYDISEMGNIDIIELNTKSKCQGTQFKLDEDNEFMKKTIFSLYNFKIKKV